MKTTVAVLIALLSLINPSAASTNANATRANVVVSMLDESGFDGGQPKSCVEELKKLCGKCMRIIRMMRVYGLRSFCPTDTNSSTASQI